MLLLQKDEIVDTVKNYSNRSICGFNFNSYISKIPANATTSHFPHTTDYDFIQDVAIVLVRTIHIYSPVNPIGCNDTNQSIWTKGWLHVRPSESGSEIGRQRTKASTALFAVRVRTRNRSPCGRIGKPLQDKRNRLSWWGAAQTAL